MLIYKATNLINGKIYIGKTIGKLEERIKSHKDSFKYKDTAFYGAIKKYGFENFGWEIIEEVNDKAKLDEREIFWIKELDSIAEHKKGYNLTWGGDGGVITEVVRNKISKYAKKRRWTVEVKAKIGASVSGVNNGFYGKHHSEETKRKISQSHSGEKSVWYGRKHTQEEIDKIRKANTGVIFSEERKRKISQARFRYLERKKVEMEVR